MALKDQDSFVVDRKYFKGQVDEAFRTFVSPLSGVYEAAFGLKPGSGPVGKKLRD